MNMALAAYEIPAAYSVVAMAAQTPERRSDAIQQFMCYWAAFNNIITVSQRENSFLEGGYPAWIRTKNNASKGRCVIR